MEQFGVKKASQNIIEGKKIKMSSSDFKGHIFYLNKDKYGKPIIHEIIRNFGNNIFLHLTFDEFLEKFKNNTFYIIES